MFFQFLIQLMLISVSSACSGVPWQPSWANQTGDIHRDDLLCDHYCDKDSDGLSLIGNKYEECCTCYSCTVWEGSEKELYIEWVSVEGSSVVFTDANASDNQVYKIEFNNRELEKFPINLCNWDTDMLRYPQRYVDIQAIWKDIVLIDFENNDIRWIPDINCLLRLDTLNLRNNKLSTISVTSFTQLTRLRNLDLAGNYIKDTDPAILTFPKLNLFDADFSHNGMTELDVSNMISLYPFCRITYDSNPVTKFVNKVNFTLSMNITFGPGFVSFKDTNFQEWPDFKQLLNLDDLSQIGKLFGFGFDFRDIPIICDCRLEPFMSLAEDIVKSVWREYHSVKCSGPPNLKGMLIANVSTSLLICNVSDDKCPTNCKCSDRPHEGLLYVDCSGQNLKYLPDFRFSDLTNVSKHIYLNLSNNMISDIGNKSYLADISVLDISDNRLKYIDSKVAELLENASFIDLSNNMLIKELPQPMQYHNVCARNMQGLTINCDCSSLWIKEWLRSTYQHCIVEEHLFHCDISDKGVRPATDFVGIRLQCLDPEFPLLETVTAVSILLLIMIGLSVYYLRYEILIICLRLRQTHNNAVSPTQLYDVFVSFNDSDEGVLDWVNEILEPSLRKASYTVFQPNRDLLYGADRDSEAISALSETRNFLFILSESYLVKPDEGMRSWTENEWKYGWNNFKHNRSKNIVLVNFDHMSPFDIEHRQIRAYLRVGSTVDFKNYHRNILQEIQTKLGKPFPKPHKAYDYNKRTAFSPETFLAKAYLPVDDVGRFFAQQQNYENDQWQWKKTEKMNMHRHKNGCQFRKCYACATKAQTLREK